MNRSRPYKLAYLVSHPIQYQAPLLRYLARQEDIDLTVFFHSDFSLRSYQDPGFQARVEWDVPLLDGYRHVFLPRLLKQGRASFFKPFSLAIKKHLQVGAFDALWVHGYASLTNLRAIRIAGSIGLPVLLRGESQIQGERSGAMLEGLRGRFLRRLFRRVDGFLAIGSENRRFYEHFGVESNRIFETPYAVDNDFFRSKSKEEAPRREQLRAELGFTPGRQVILFASKFLERKRPLDLIEAFHRLNAKQRARFELLFVGDGSERHRVEQHSGCLGTRNVRFVGFQNQSELPRFYDLCDLFVLPSSYEPWGLVVNEVMNADRPVIATDRVGAAWDLIDDGLTGFRIPAEQPTLLAKRLQAFAANPKLAGEMGRRAGERIRSWSFEQDYQGLIHALERTAS